MKFLSIIVIGILISSCKTEQCETFDYDTFDLDPRMLERGIKLNNNENYLFLEVKDFQLINTPSVTSSFTVLKKCSNGYRLEYICDSLGVDFFISFLRNSNGYEYYFSSIALNTQISLIGVQELDDISFEVSAKEDALVKKIIFAKGLIIGLIDFNGKAWSYKPN